jgi:hypothetical protein
MYATFTLGNLKGRDNLKNLDVDEEKIEMDLEEIGRNGMFQVRVQWRNFAKAAMKEAIRFTSQYFLNYFICSITFNHAVSNSVE